MIYRIVATILLVVAVVAMGVYLEPSTGTSRSVSPPASSSDDGAMKSLRIN